MIHIPFPSGRRYRVIYADPPWKYRDKAAAGKRGVEFKYPTMTVEEIKELPVSDIAEKDSVLFLWCTPPMEREGHEVMEAWGFQYKTFAFVWVKTNKDGSIFKGMGHYTRANAEPCLLGIRGKGLDVKDHSVSQVIIAPRRRHSEKPPEARERIERLYGDVPRIELFARERVEGWDAWGLEVDTNGGAGTWMA